MLLCSNVCNVTQIIAAPLMVPGNPPVTTSNGTAGAPTAGIGNHASTPVANGTVTPPATQERGQQPANGAEEPLPAGSVSQSENHNKRKTCKGEVN